MPSVNSMMGLITKLESPYITVSEERCVLVRNRNADCLKCASVCTSGCIHYDGEQLIISPEKCIGCGTCATVCPTCCLEAHHPNDAVLLDACRTAAQHAEGTVTIACGELLDRAKGLVEPNAVARVECLGRVEESLLTTLAAEGIDEVVLVRGDCAHCDHATGWRMAQQVLATEQQLLDAWHSPMKVRLSEKLPGKVRAHDDGFDKSKRAAFRSGGKQAMAVGATVAEYAARDALGQEQEEPQETEPPQHYLHVMDDGTLPHFLPDRRERLLDALAQLGEPEDVMIDTRLWGHVIIDTDKCISCRMCATFCPTGALQKFDNDDGTFGVTHYPGDCVKCRCCTTICPADALTLSEEVFAVDMLAGATDAYEMKPVTVEKGKPHTIMNVMRTLTNGSQVYER